MRAFALATRDLGSQGGANLVGSIKPQDIGVIGWSARGSKWLDDSRPLARKHFGLAHEQTPAGGPVAGNWKVNANQPELASFRPFTKADRSTNNL
jgi:hypothetical protein